MDNVLAQALAQTTLYTDEALYSLVHLPARAITPAAGILAEIGQAFSALIVDKDEVTLVIQAEDLADYAGRLPGLRIADGYRLITFDLPLDLALVGFMRVISAALAEAGVPLMAFSAFERDHLLVPEAQFTQAWQALQALIHPAS